MQTYFQCGMRKLSANGVHTADVSDAGYLPSNGCVLACVLATLQDRPYYGPHLPYMETKVQGDSVALLRP